MNVTLKYITPDPEAHIGEAAAKCYDSDTSREACLRRAKHCKDSGHLATLRFAYADFEIGGLSRICSHQIVRLAHAGILQESQRYVKQSAVRFIQPPALAYASPHLIKRWNALEALSKEVYGLALGDGMKKEDARFALLHSAETSLRMCMNFQAWRDFLNNRTSKAAQWEVRSVAQSIQQQLAQHAPNLFGA